MIIEVDTDNELEDLKLSREDQLYSILKALRTILGVPESQSIITYTVHLTRRVRDRNWEALKAYSPEKGE